MLNIILKEMKEKWARMLCTRTLTDIITMNMMFWEETQSTNLMTVNYRYVFLQFWSYSFFCLFVLFLEIAEHDSVYCLSLIWIIILFQDSES